VEHVENIGEIGNYIQLLFRKPERNKISVYLIVDRKLYLKGTECESKVKVK
jgi:hypothetical protein